jgi:hypothetical protein
MNVAAQQLQQFDPRQIRIIGGAVLLLLLAAGVSYGLLPKWRAYQTARSSLTVLESTVAGATDLESQLAALRDQVAGVERTLNGDASNRPLKQVESFVIERLQVISWRNEMQLVGVEPRIGGEFQQFRELLFDVELNGDYFDFFAWLKEIDEELGFIVVKRFATNVADNTAAEPRLMIRLTLAAYRSADT